MSDGLKQKSPVSGSKVPGLSISFNSTRPPSGSVAEKLKHSTVSAVHRKRLVSDDENCVTGGRFTSRFTTTVSRSVRPHESLTVTITTCVPAVPSIHSLPVAGSYVPPVTTGGSTRLESGSLSSMGPKQYCPGRHRLAWKSAGSCTTGGRLTVA